MRISSTMIYDAGVKSINRQSADLLHTQQQLSTGRRILTPSDDPVAAARALEITQTVDINKQYAGAQGYAEDALGLMDAQLESASELLSQARTLVVQAGSGTLASVDRKAIATQLRASFEQLMGIANTTDGTGQYLFAGHMGDTKPFVGTVDEGVTYFGDEGQRRLQVSASRQMEVTESGNNLFNRVAAGNGSFITDFDPNNIGTGVIDSGSVTNSTNWQSSSNSGNLKISFWIDTTGSIGAPNTTYYDLIDESVNPPMSLFNGGTSIAGGPTNTFTHAYNAGSPITFSGLAAPYTDFGATVTVTGNPQSNDSFTIKRSSSLSVFDSMIKIIQNLESPTTTAAAVGLNQVGVALTSFDHAQQNMLTARTRVGSRLNEIESLKSENSNLNLQHQQVLSKLQDLDFAKAISELTMGQTQLEAAQKSFATVSKLSLFDYVG